MSQVIAIVNQKGGVAKTTTTVNLAAALVQQDERTLCVDLDPQANLTMSLGCQNPDTVIAETQRYPTLTQAKALKQFSKASALNKEGLFITVQAEAPSKTQMRLINGWE